MGRCNGGGGRRNGGGGWQEGQNIGKKSGKTGHGKSGQHDATTTQREVQKRDKNGQPLNFGPFRNGYYVGKEKPAASAERVGLASDQMQELSTLLTQSSLSSPAVASDEAAASSSGSGTYQAPRRSQLRCADAGGGESKMTASQQRESERLLREHEALLTSDTHKRLRAIRSALPAFDSRAAVLAAIASEQVLIICGETGCGKSTQVPQYVLEASIEAGVGVPSAPCSSHSHVAWRLCLWRSAWRRSAARRLARPLATPSGTRRLQAARRPASCFAPRA